MSDLRGYRELDAQTVRAFAAPYLGEEVETAEEFGDGNLNLVFRVTGKSRSVIVKQGLPYLRVAGESWPLTRHRARIEADAIRCHSKLAPSLLPHLIGFDEDMSALVLEDLTDHVSWREALIAARSVPGVAEAVGRYTAGVLIGTSDLVLPSRERKALRREFVYSELCVVTEDLVFTAPYIDTASNRYDPEIASLAEALRRDQPLRTAAAELRYAFKTRDEALIHGDLHSGSVMVHDDNTRIIDLEFAFFGPAGFDPGILLANLAMSKIAHEVMGNYRFARVVDEYCAEYWDALTDEAHRLWPATEPWAERFLGQLLSDAGRFAGMEMIRRVVGLAHAKDIDVLPAPHRHVAQSRTLAGGRSLILGTPIVNLRDLWQRATSEETYQ